MEVSKYIIIKFRKVTLILYSSMKYTLKKVL